MLAVKPRSWAESNEELDSTLAISHFSDACGLYLASIGIGATVGHAQYSGASMFQRRVNLIFEFLAIDRAPTSSSARRIASLQHKVGDDTMKYLIVVVASLGKGSKVLASLYTLAGSFFPA